MFQPGQRWISTAEPELGLGTILRVDPTRGLLIALAKGALWLRRVKPAGKREMGAADYANGARLKAGDRLPLEDAA